MTLGNIFFVALHKSNVQTLESYCHSLAISLRFCQNLLNDGSGANMYMHRDFFASWSINKQQTGHCFLTLLWVIKEPISGPEILNGFQVRNTLIS